MKYKITFYVLLICTLTSSMNLEAMKRKHEDIEKEEKEPEKGSEEKVLGEAYLEKNKKRKDDQEQESLNDLNSINLNDPEDPIAQRFINALMQASDETTLMNLLNQHYYTKIEIKAYLTKLINKPNRAGETILHQANNSRQVRALLALGADPTQRSHMGQIPFHTMLALGNVVAAETLLDILKIEPYIEYDKSNLTTLHYAIFNNAATLVQRIIANKNQKNQQHLQQLITRAGSAAETLIIAAALYCPSCIKTLIKHGANINQQDVFDQIPAIMHAAKIQTSKVIELLVHYGAFIDSVDNQNLDILTYALINNNFELIQYLINKKIFAVDNNPYESYNGIYEFLMPLGITVENFINTAQNQQDLYTNKSINPQQLITQQLIYNQKLSLLESIIDFLINEGASVRNTYSIYGKPLLIYLLNEHNNNVTIINLIKNLINNEKADVDLSIISPEESMIVEGEETREYPLAALIFFDYDHHEADNVIKEDSYLNYDLITFLIEHGAKIRNIDLDAIKASDNKRLIEIASQAPLFDEDEFQKNIALAIQRPDIQPLKVEEVDEEFIDTSKAKSLKYFAAQQFIRSYLYSDNQSQADKLRKQYESAFPEAQEYLATIVNEPNSMGLTLLHTAQTSDRIIKLWSLGAVPSRESKIEQTPFSCLLAHGSVEAAQKLLDIQQKEPVEIVDLTDFSTLHYALMANEPDLALDILNNFPQDIIDLEESITEVFGRNQTTLLLAAQYCPEFLTKLVKLGIKINTTDRNGITPFLIAATRQPQSVLESLVKLGADPKLKDFKGSNALMYAIRGKNPSVIEYLISSFSFNPNEHPNNDPTLLTPFEYALSKINKPQYKEIILELLRNGGTPNTAKTNLTEIIPQAYYNTDLIKVFIDYGADVNYQGKFKKYPLASALFDWDGSTDTYQEHLRKDLNYSLIEYLIQKGARIDELHKKVVLESNDEQLIALINRTK